VPLDEDMCGQFRVEDWLLAVVPERVVDGFAAAGARLGVVGRELDCVAAIAVPAPAASARPAEERTSIRLSPSIEPSYLRWARTSPQAEQWCLGEG